MSRVSKPKPAPQAPAAAPSTEALPPVTPDPANTSQVAPDPTGAASAPASAAVEAAAASVDPKPAEPVEDHSQMRGPEGYAVIVTGPAKGRWRIGRKFGPEPVSIPAQELTEADLRALDEDPELTLHMEQIEA